ncbi:unnamed protein product [Linum trigynum]|uniref:Uncharacterized protein n=1 Tax=Linum trigynum TaxID=586398 RepID=A0AAV2GS07_9ROSI
MNSGGCWLFMDWSAEEQRRGTMAGDGGTSAKDCGWRRVGNLVGEEMAEQQGRGSGKEMAESGSVALVLRWGHLGVGRRENEMD